MKLPDCSTRTMYFSIFLGGTALAASLGWGWKSWGFGLLFAIGTWAAGEKRKMEAQG